MSDDFQIKRSAEAFGNCFAENIPVRASTIIYFLPVIRSHLQSSAKLGWRGSGHRAKKEKVLKIEKAVFGTKPNVAFSRSPVKNIIF